MLLLNMHNKFQLSSLIWRGDMRGTNSRNDRNVKTRPKTTSLGLKGFEMGLKSRDPQKAHLGHLLNVHT